MKKMMNDACTSLCVKLEYRDVKHVCQASFIESIESIKTVYVHAVCLPASLWVSTWWHTSMQFRQCSYRVMIVMNMPAFHYNDFKKTL
jgi:hypothetical protein